MMKYIDRAVDSGLSSFVNYPLSWSYSIGLVAFKPMIDALLPVLTQGLVLFFIHIMMIFVEWLKNRIGVRKPLDNGKAMDILNDLEDKIARRKDIDKNNDKNHKK